MKERFLKVAVKEDVKTQINILAAVSRKDISVFVGELVQAVWEDAKAAGKVSDAMLAESPAPSLPTGEGAGISVAEAE